jgi:hypothetical protein
MKRYYFDLRDGNSLARDEEGVELPDIQAAQEKAARSLADMARDALRRGPEHVRRHHMAIEVRDRNGPVLQATYLFETFKS